MSLIIHMKIPGAIVIASDCRVTGTEQLYLTLKDKTNDSEEKCMREIGKIEELALHPFIEGERNQLQFGKYDYIKSDSEQKSFLLTTKSNSKYAVSYCGNANLNGYPASYVIKEALKKMTDVDSTFEIAKRFNDFWNQEKIDNKPSLLISGYNDGKQSIIELKPDGEIKEHYSANSLFGFTFHGEQSMVSALIELETIEYSLFRLKDAIDFCAMLITTTAKMQFFQKRQQTVSEAYDLLVITESKAEWIHRNSFEI